MLAKSTKLWVGIAVLTLARLLVFPQIAVVSELVSRGWESRLSELQSLEDSLSQELVEIQKEITTIQTAIAKAQMDSLIDQGFAFRATLNGRARMYSVDDMSPMGSLPRGAEVTVLGYWARHYKVSYGSRTGYILDWFDRSDESVARMLEFLEAAYEENGAKDKEERARRGEAEARERRVGREQRLVKHYGEATAGRLIRGEFWIGMTSDMARESLGSPGDINRTVYQHGVHEQWVYRSPKRYLYFEDGKLTSWQD